MAKKQRMKSEMVKLVTPEFRASYPQLFEARAAGTDPAAKKKYSISMIFRVAPNPKDPNEPVVDIAPLKNLVRAVVEEKYGTDRTKWPPIAEGDPKVGYLSLPFRDGNDQTHKDKPGYGLGTIFVSAAKNGDQVRPGVVHAHAGPDGKPAPVTAPSDVYGGCYCRAEVNAYFWEYMGKMGVSLGLNHVQKLRDGEPFGAAGAAEDAFEAITPPTGAPAAASGTGL